MKDRDGEHIRVHVRLPQQRLYRENQAEGERSPTGCSNSTYIRGPHIPSPTRCVHMRCLAAVRSKLVFDTLHLNIHLNSMA